MIKRLKNYIKVKSGIDRINKRLDFLSAYLNLTAPTQLHLDPEVMEQVQQLMQKHEKVRIENTAIHKNDLMFAFHLYHVSHDIKHGVLSYFRAGYKLARNLKAIAEENNLETNRILDFGSGYGRVSRFLPQLFPDAEIEISEVKQPSIQFQKEAFDFTGIHHGQDARSFYGSGYEMILALSVFTHLPKPAFEAWLAKLIDCLAPGGALVFTYFEIEESPYRSQDGFYYLKRSEDQLFSFLADSLNNVEEYGETYVSRDYLTSQLSLPGLEHQFLGEKLSSQKAVMVRKVN